MKALISGIKDRLIFPADLATGALSQSAD